MLFNKIEKLVTIKVDIFSAHKLQHGDWLELPEMRHVLPVIFNPLWFLNVDFVVQIVKNGPHVHARCCEEPYFPCVTPVRILVE